MQEIAQETMQNSSLLEDVLETLEQDENLLRVKRLIVFSCHGFWVDDPNDLQSMELRVLIEELLAAIPDVDTLKHMLNSSVKKLSKPEVYAIVADLIIDSIGLLYSTTRASSLEFNLPSPEDLHSDFAGDLPISALHPIENIELNELELSTEISDIEYASDDSTALERKLDRLVGKKFEAIPNLFDLKLEIVNSVSPLRAKILIFSMLYFDFNPRDRDWSSLNTHDLSELLQSLYQISPSLEGLEESLNQTATKLDSPQEYGQVAGAIAHYMKPLYFS